MLRDRFLIPLIWLAKQTEANGKPVQVIYAGTFHLADRDQVIEITEDMIDQMVANFAAVDGPDRLPISVNHSSHTEKLETARAVGWVVSLAKEKTKDQVSLMASPRWLEDTLEAIRNEEFKYISAEIVFKDADRTTGEAIGCHLVGMALTNIPAIPDLRPIALAVSDLATRVQFAKERISRQLQLAQKSLLEQFFAVMDAFYRAFPAINETCYDVVEAYVDNLIVVILAPDFQKMYRVGYTTKDGVFSFDPRGQWQEVERQYVPVGQKDVAAVQGEPDITLPYPNEHAARITDPDQYDSMRRKNNEMGDGVHVIYGIKDGKSEVQAIRFDAKKFTPAEAKKWCKDHDFKPIEFEPATDVSANQNNATGVGEAPQTIEKEEGMDEQKIRELLGLAPDADLMQALTELKTKAATVDALTAEVGTLKTEKAAVEAAKGEADTALSAKQEEVVTLTTQVKAVDTEKVELTARVEKLEAEKAEKDAQALRQKALAERKVTPAEFVRADGTPSDLAGLARSQPALFASIMEGRTAYDADLFTELSAAATEDPPAGDNDAFWTAVDAYHETNPGTKPAVARAAVLAAHPEFAKLFTQA